ncbi:DDE_Tnp_IS1595 domain-containing protein [Caerostris darwini]|uniref:DDE_Tnp_IS1595 domain-containing protein n=1 Tax=Caerostris darwini TaxID=1538125 RepID=A0AAV4RL50_9ARAC|nr:DDE_Tnp_IS1595 domain-containing protein [Caerostris darwini]
MVARRTNFHRPRPQERGYEYRKGGMLPKKDPAPMCPKCEGQTKSSTDNSRKLGWVWRCMNRRKRACSGKVNPLSNTFFKKSLITFSDMFILLCLFVWKFPITKALTITNFYRAKREQKQMSSETINDYFAYFREVAEVFASHNNKLLGGPGKTIEVDETFLTKRKYHRGRRTNSMTQTIFGMFCRDEKEGLFFLTKGKSKRELWPFIKHHCHPETSIICNDKAKQTRMRNIPENEQIDLFMKDVSKVYAGYGNENMEMLEITVPDADSEGIGHLCGGVATQTSSEEESDLDPLSYTDNCDEDPDWENC